MTNADGIEPVCGMLYNMDITETVISDKEDFKKFLENNRKYWDYVDEELERLKEEESSVTFYLSNDDEGKEKLNTVQKETQTLKNTESGKQYGRLCVLYRCVRDEDWSENWKKYFHPLPIGEKVLIVPEWEQNSVENKENRTIFTINPGMSFGTGSHESTQMCIEEIEKNIKNGDKILDLGCGSGILSVIALLLGGECATAVDIDEKAVETAFSNLKLNGLLPEKMTGFAGDVTDDERLREKIGNDYEIVVANIVSDVIIALAPYIRSFMKKDGVFICSGIINERQEEVKEALTAAGLICEKVRTRNEWSAIVCR